VSVKIISDDTFESEIQNSDKLTLVDFWAEWCGPCKMLAPVIQAIAEKYQEQMVVCKIDTDKNPQSAQKSQITSIPCCILYKNGAEVHRIIGHQPQAKIEEQITPFL